MGLCGWRVLAVHGEGGGPRWGEEDFHQVKCVTSKRQENLHCGVLSSEEPFMTSSGCGWMDVKARAWRDRTPPILFFSLQSDWKTVIMEGVELAKADKTHLVQECRCVGF